MAILRDVAGQIEGLNTTTSCRRPFARVLLEMEMISSQVGPLDETKGCRYRPDNQGHQVHDKTGCGMNVLLLRKHEVLVKRNNVASMMVMYLRRGVRW